MERLPGVRGKGRFSSARSLTYAAILLLTVNVAAQTSRVAAWTADIDYLRTELPKRHPNAFAVTSQQSFEAMLVSVQNDIASLSDYGIAVRLQQAVASLHDAHTEFDTRIAPMTYYPIRVYSFSDGIFVTKTTDASRGACGAQLIAIDGVPIDDVYARVLSTVSRENEAWGAQRAMELLPRAELLYELGVARSQNAATFTFSRNGVLFDLALQPISVADAVATVFAADKTDDSTPLYRRQAAARYWFTSDNDLLYIKYNSCSNDPALPFATFTTQITTNIDQKTPSTVVIDLRDNRGGDTAVAQPLIAALQQRSQLRGRLYAIIGRATISSALINAIQLRDQAGAVLVGEDTGGKPWSYGEQRSFQLPNSHFTVFHSTKFFKLEAVEHPSLEPSIERTIASDDFFSNRDPFLDALLAQRQSTNATPSARRRAASPVARRTCPN